MSKTSKIMLAAEEMMDTVAIKMFTATMSEKMEFSRSNGKSGWWNRELCSVENLRILLNEHMDKGDMVDIANLAMMIWFRENHVEELDD